MAQNGKNVLDQGLDAFVNLSTMGLVGYEGDGQFGKGIVTTSADETLGEISGRNIQREMLQDQKNALEAQKLKDAETRAAALKQTEIDDVNASNAAGVAQSNRRLRALAAQQNSTTIGGPLGVSSSNSNSYLGL